MPRASFRWASSLAFAVAAVAGGCNSALPKPLESTFQRDETTGAPDTVGQRLITAQATVVVDADVATVWRIVSDSSLAVKWSVYFDHISALGEGDGGVGSVRRCYRTADEKGIRWDEEVLEVEPERLRRMRIFNLRGSAVSRVDQAEYDVWQVIEPLSPAQTRVTFRTTLRDGRPMTEGTLFALGRGEVERVFRLNLENIKALIEEGDGYVRLHPWEPLRGYEVRAAARADAEDAAAQGVRP